MLIMPLFFFHTQRPGSELVEDEEGQELKDLDAVRKEATVIARELLAEGVRAGFDLLKNVVVVTDSRGQRVWSVAFEDTIGPPP
jgi:hypothetical protein